MQVSLSIPKLEEKVKSYCEQLDMSLEELSDAAKELSNLGSGEASNGNFTIHKSCNQNHKHWPFLGLAFILKRRSDFSRNWLINIPSE